MAPDAWPAFLARKTRPPARPPGTERQGGSGAAGRLLL